jgi:hypothetical protein
VVGVAVSLGYTETSSSCTLVIDPQSMKFPSGSSTGASGFAFNPDGFTDEKQAVMGDTGGLGTWTYVVTTP